MPLFPSSPRRGGVLFVTTLLLYSITSHSLFAAGLTIGEGAYQSLGAGTIDLDCGDLVVDGTLDLDSGILSGIGNVAIGANGTLNAMDGAVNLSGDWNNAGTFDSGNSLVTINEACSSDPVNVSGSSTFHGLTIRPATARRLNFESGSTTTIGAGGALDLGGSAGAFLTIRSSSAGSPAYLMVDEGATYVIDHVDVMDSHATLPGQWLDFGEPGEFDSVDSGGNERWFRSAAEQAVRFRVTTRFDDGNTGEITVHISCNGGLPLSQSFNISAGNPVEFVVSSVQSEEGPNCHIWQEPGLGYITTYDNEPCSTLAFGGCSVDNSDTPSQGCYFTDVFPGEGEQPECSIDNVLQAVPFTVGTVWQPQGQLTGIPLDASTTVECSNTASGQADSWSWDSDGDHSATVDVYPRWQGDTACTVSQLLLANGGIESSGCTDNFAFEPGDAEQSCTRVNAVFYEGIPTLHTMGLILMALLIMGTGAIGFRRYG